ncbi:MAG: NAD(P)/FAD-dependent oxidoreductase [Sphingobacteriales bacterium]|nr:MAG: NAD(P)/FAD-dependent oxidoreductase [Sphingobacteriales bacterium]
MSTTYDAIIIGGSYSGLSAAMALGRSMRKTLVIDGGKPCNAPTPHSHNFITQDGETPVAIRNKAREQVAKYDTVSFADVQATMVTNNGDSFTITAADGQTYTAKRLLLATGIRDIMPNIPGFAECWGKSVIHCPYCHGYEVRGQKTAAIGNGDVGYHVGLLLTNWTKDLKVFTNGPATFSAEQLQALQNNNVPVIEKKISELLHEKGQVKAILFADGSEEEVSAVYNKPAFEQHSDLHAQLGVKLNEMGYIDVDFKYKTSVPGVYAAGDNTNMMRAVASAVAAGNMAGAMINAELIFG